MRLSFDRESFDRESRDNVKKCKKLAKDHRLRKKFDGSTIRPLESDQSGKFIERVYEGNQIMSAEVAGPTNTIG